MKRHKSMGPMIRNGELKFWTPVNFEVEYFLNEETEGVLTDTVTYFSDQHLTRIVVNSGWIVVIPNITLKFGANNFNFIRVRLGHVRLG